MGLGFRVPEAIGIRVSGARGEWVYGFRVPTTFNLGKGIKT
jgi:hypothetical protein